MVEIKGFTIWYKEQTIFVAEDGKMKLYPVILLPKDKLVDTNGAGTDLLPLVFKC